MISPEVAAETYHKHKSAMRAAEELGISNWTLYRILKECGIKTCYAGAPGRSKVKLEELQRWKSVKAAIDSGSSKTEVAKQFKVTRQRIHQILRKLEQHELGLGLPDASVSTRRG